MLSTETLEPTSTNRFTIGDITCDISQGVIEIGDKLIQLEPRLCGVLALLVQRGRTIITRDEFLDTVWDSDGSDEALTQAISRLRKILGDSNLIETLPRIGYRLTVAPQAATASGQMRSRPNKTGRFNWSNLRTIYIGILLVIVGAAAFLLGTYSNVGDQQQLEMEIENAPDLEFHKIPEKSP